MEYYQPLDFLADIKDTYDGTYLLIVPLGILFFNNMITELAVSTKRLGKMILRFTVSILLFIGFLIQLRCLVFKYDVNLLNTVFDRFTMLLFIFDKLNIMRSFFLVSQIHEEKAQSLIALVKHKLTFELILGVIEALSFFAFSSKRGWLLAIFILFHIYQIFSSHSKLTKEYFKLTGHNESYLLSAEKGDGRSWINKIVIMFNSFLGGIYNYLFCFQLDLQNQYVSLMCIIFLTYKSLIRCMYLLIFFYMVDDVTYTDEEMCSFSNETLESKKDETKSNEV